MKTSSLMICCFLICVFAIGSGCTMRHGDFTVISNKMVRLSEFEVDKADRIRNVKGTDVQHMILGIPLSGPPTLEGAMDDAFEKGGGDVMTDAVVTSEFFTFILYGKNSWVIKGDTIKTRR